MALSKGCTISLIVVGVLIIMVMGVIGFIVSGLNQVVTLDEAVKASWAQVENQLQRRNDLIPNLVNTVKGYASHEEGIFKHVADARAKLAGAINTNKPIGERIAAAKEMTSALSRLLVVVENYPDLKANQTFTRLMDELSGTENRIAVERMRYNRMVGTFNAHIRRIPGSFFAGMKGLTSAVYFKVEESAKAVPKVEF